jgi:hypothetical protein
LTRPPALLRSSILGRLEDIVLEVAAALDVGAPVVPLAAARVAGAPVVPLAAARVAGAPVVPLAAARVAGAALPSEAERPA